MNETREQEMKSDPAWPRDCSASLWSCVLLPHGYIPTQSACRSVEHARQMAEKDAGRALEWKERQRDNGHREFYSQRLPYKTGEQWWVIWA